MEGMILASAVNSNNRMLKKSASSVLASFRPSTTDEDARKAEWLKGFSVRQDPF
jgi:hypothetical protein